jgi:hypothetical protein
LSGHVGLEALRTALADECAPSELNPSGPSDEVAAVRAVSSTLRPNQRLEVVSKRRLWEVEELGVGTDAADGVGTRTHAKCLRVSVEETPDGARRVNVMARGVEWEGQRDQAIAAIETYTGLLTHNDISEWLIWVAVKFCSAITLRDSGGIYFIPKDKMPLWTAVTEALQSVSSHTCFNLPSMRTEDAAHALMASVRGEADAAMADFESYLTGKVSTKGLNACERDLEAALAKVEMYCDLLGSSLPTMFERAESVRGAIVAARLTVRSAK